jgi:hypothetical protein
MARRGINCPMTWIHPHQMRSVNYEKPSVPPKPIKMDVEKKKKNLFYNQYMKQQSISFHLKVKFDPKSESCPGVSTATSFATITFAVEIFRWYISSSVIGRPHTTSPIVHVTWCIRFGMTIYQWDLQYLLHHYCCCRLPVLSIFSRSIGNGRTDHFHFV